MRSTTSIAFISLTILSSGIGCELIARVERGNIPNEEATGGAAGMGQSSSSSSSSSSNSGSSSSSSGQAGMGGAGGAGGMGGSGGGGGPACVLDSDCPATNTNCLLPKCNNQACETLNETAGAACNDNNGKLCDGQGKCVECLAATDCTSGTVCQIPTCSAGICSLVDSAPGTEVGDPLPGDCLNVQCNATGMAVTGNDDSDLPMPANACKVGACSMGVPSIGDAPMGTMCGVMNTFCDGMGNCVGCTLNVQCGTPTECNTPQCTNMTCIDNFTADGTPLMSQTANDCQVAQCNGAGGIKQVPDDLDLPLDDGNPCTDQACMNGAATFPASSVGKPCNQNGGKVCDGNSNCVECNLAVDCASGICSMSVCQPPQVVSVVPADAASGVVVGSSIAITFSGTMNAATLVGQTATGPCTGSVQFSVDNFATCYGFGSAMPMMSPDNKTATFTPAPGLSYGTNYKVKVTTGAQDTSGKALASDFVQPMGFATEVPQSSCAGSVVISQIFTAGGTNGAPYTNDFVELHNRGAQAVSVAGWTLQYAIQNGTSWQGPTLTGTIPAGGYYLIQLGSGGANGAALPTPDLVNGTALVPNAGKLALVSNSTALSGGCPTGAQIRDFVGYGGTGCFEGLASAGQPANNQAIFRKNAGCTDTNQNGTDTELLAPAPRNLASMALQCECPVANANGTANESDLGIELDYCNVQFPTNIMVMAGQMTPMIYGRVYEAGLTEAMGANAAITAEVGFGPANVNPENQSGFVYFPAAYNIQSGNDDEYQAMFAAPMTAGSYRYVYRFSRDGVSWTYCDKNGSGSNGGLSFEIHELPTLTVMP